MPNDGVILELERKPCETFLSVGSHTAPKFLAALNQDLISALRGCCSSAPPGVRRVRSERAIRVSHAGKLPTLCFKHANALAGGSPAISAWQSGIGVCGRCVSRAIHHPNDY